MNKTICNIIGAITTPKGMDCGILFLRVTVGAIMITHGLAKAANFEALSNAFADPIGLGGKLSFMLILLAELVGSTLVILGLFTRPAAFSLVFGMGVAAFIVHAPFTISGSELPLVYFLIFIALTMSGGGRYSVDRYMSRCSATKHKSAKHK